MCFHFHDFFLLLLNDVITGVEKISILVLNRGVHHGNEAPQAIEKTLGKVVATFPNISVFWRNSPGGHEHCEKYFEDKLRTSMRPYENTHVLLNNSTMLTGKSLYWDRILQQNEVIYEMIRKKFPSVCSCC